jgi:putative methylase
MKKKELELLLSQLSGFNEPKVRLEQYQTHASIVADLLWNAKLNRHITGKVIADLGCGPGSFGIGALLLGAKKVYFLDVDKSAIKTAKENLKKAEKIAEKKLKAEFLHMDVKEFSEKVDVVLQNPPFGVKRTHHDKLFLIKAMELTKTIYSFHKISTKEFVEKFAKENGFTVKRLYRYDFPIEKSFFFHMKKVRIVDVGCWCLKK